MPTIRAESGKQVRVSVSDLFRGSRKVRVEKAEVAARKRAKSLDKSLDKPAVSKPTSPKSESPKPAVGTITRSPKSKPGKTAKANQEAPGSPTQQTKALVSGALPPLEIPQTANDTPGNASEWTSEQDARLKRLKRADAGWKAISALMGKSTQDLKTHWAELQMSNDHKDAMSRESSVVFTGWTPELDARLAGLKEANTSWKTIAATLRKTVNEVKARWAVLSVAAMEEREEESAQNKAVPMDEVQLRQHRRQVSFSSPLIMPGSATTQNINVGTRKPILFIDEDFNMDDIVLLNKIASKFEEEKWLRITSRFYDKTGKRITMQQAKSRVVTRELEA